MSDGAEGTAGADRDAEPGIPADRDEGVPGDRRGEGRNAFRVEAALDAGAAVLRPGMEGVAKIETGEQRALWIWTRRLIDWVRLQLWKLWP